MEQYEGTSGWSPCITWDQFKDMFSACQYRKMPNLMAILERTVVNIAGDHAVYLGLPSEQKAEPILWFRYEGITEDWLRDKNKDVHTRAVQFAMNIGLLPQEHTFEVWSQHLKLSYRVDTVKKGENVILVPAGDSLWLLGLF